MSKSFSSSEAESSLVFARGPGPTMASPAASLAAQTPAVMTCAQFNRFGRASGILELVGMKAPELEILFIRQCSTQKWTASAPAQKLMYHTTFTATLIEIAARAYPSDDPGRRLRRLLDTIRSNLRPDTPPDEEE